MVDDLVASMFDLYKRIVEADMAKRSYNFIQGTVCIATYYSEIGLQFLASVFEDLSGLDDSTRLGQKLVAYIGTVAELFKAPMSLLGSAMSQLSHDSTHTQLSEVCFNSSVFSGISVEAKAMALLVAKIAQDKTKVTLNTWHLWAGMTDTSASVKVPFTENMKVLDAQVSEAIKSIVQGHDSSFEEVIAYLDPREDQMRQSGREKVSRQYNAVLKVAKYKMHPVQSQMTELARVGDMEHCLDRIDVSYGRKSPRSFVNYSPVLLHCRFGDEDESKDCEPAMVSFTESGLGYTINGESFFQLYKESSQMETFCKEIVQRTDVDMCMRNQLKLDKDPTLIKTNGSKFAVRLVLNTPQKTRYSWFTKRLAIHSPHSISDSAGTGFEPIAGTHTTVVVTPHVTETDASLLAKDKSVRMCHSQEHDGNSLKLFRNYTKDNCLYECHVEDSINKCGCVPWNFPKLDEHVRTCSHVEVACFERERSLSKRNNKCLHCMDECYKIDYEYTIHTKPMQNICQDNPGLKKAVNQEVNNFIYNFLPHEQSVQVMGLDTHLKDPCITYVGKNAAVVDFQIGPKSAVKITRSARVTDVDQLASFGKLFFTASIAVYKFKSCCCCCSSCSCSSCCC